MRNFKITLLALTACLSLSAFGASIDHIQNYTAEYGGNPAQQGAINQGSTVYFNPAGLMRLENGTYFVGGLQYAFGEQEMHNGESYKTDLSSPIPNIAIYKKTDDGAYFWTLGAIAGGAELEYKDSIPLKVKGMDLNQFLSGTNVKGSNQYIQTTLGKAYNLTDKWSASVAIRGVYGKRTLEASSNVNSLISIEGIPVAKSGSASIDSERTATGVGAQFGLNYAPSDRLNIGFRYDTKVRLNFKTDASISDSTKIKFTEEISTPGVSGALLGMYPVYADGLKTRRDLPAIAALGASYKVTNRWTTFIGGNYYFNESATMDRVGKANYDYDNGWEVSLGSEYQINDKISWLLGFNYADTGAPKESYSATEYAINSTMVGTGLKIKQNETTEWTIAYNHYFYDTTSAANSSGDRIEYSKEISSIGVNFTKRF